MKDENSSRRVNLSEKPSQKILNQSFSQWVKSQGALERCSKEKVFYKYAANLQENTHVKV